MQKPSDYFKKLDLAHLDANTAQFIREKILTLPNIDILESTKEFETIKAIVEENFPRAIGIEPVVISPIVEEIPEPIIEAVVEPIIDIKQEEIKTISVEIAEMTDLVDLLNEVVAENPQDLDSMDVLELYKETLVELSNKLKSLTEVITEAVSEVKDNIEEVKEVIKTDVVDTKGILTAPKKYKTEDGEEVLGYESDWNFGTKKNLGETVVYYVNKESDSDKYSVLTGILHKGEVIYSEDKISNKEFENKFDSEKEALDFAYGISLDKEYEDKFSLGGVLLGAALGVAATLGVQKANAKNAIPVKKEKVKEVKEKWNDVVKSYIDKEGFDYAMDGYSDYSEVKVPQKFHDLKVVYLKDKTKLEKHITSSLSDTDKDNVLSAIDKEGFDSAFEFYSDFKEIKDSKFHKLIKTYLKSKKELSDYIGLDKYGKGGSVKSFKPESLIGYSFLGNVESSTIIGVKEISKDNIKLERKSNVGELKYESSFTFKELKDLYLGKKVGQYEAFRPVMEKGGEIDEIRSGAVVKWKGKDGVYDVIGTYEGNVTLREINPDPNRDYKGSYKADIKDLELVQKSTTPKDHISEYDMVIYKDIDGEFTKKGKVEKMYYQDGILLYKVEGAGSYTIDEIKKIK